MFRKPVKGRRSFRQLVADELEILPMLNLFIALIPMLLISAVFLEVTVIDMHLPPADADAAAADAEGLGLTLALGGETWHLTGRGIADATLPAPPTGTQAWGELLGELSARHPDEGDIVIVSRPRTRYERIILAMDIAREAGWPRVSLYGESGGDAP